MSVGGARGALVFDAGGAQPRCSGASRRGAEMCVSEAGCAVTMLASTRSYALLLCLWQRSASGTEPHDGACVWPIKIAANPAMKTYKARERP
jgi:hypothetical protein